MGDDQPMWEKRSKEQFTSRSAIKKTDDKVEISKGLIKMIDTISFDGEPSGDPYQHLEAFEDICDLFNTKGDEPTSPLSRSEPSSGIIEQLFRQFSPEQGKMSTDVEQQIQAFVNFVAGIHKSTDQFLRDVKGAFPHVKIDEQAEVFTTMRGGKVVVGPPMPKTDQIPNLQVVEPEVELPSHPTREVREETVRPKESATPHVPTRVPYPARLRNEKIETQYHKFIELIKQVDINVPLVDLIVGMPNYVKFLKELVANEAKTGAEEIAFLSAECSAILSDTPKKGDPGSFTIPCYFGKSVSCRALADLGASINLMPLSFYQRLGLKDLKSTRMTIQRADRYIKYPVGIAEDVIVQVDKFVFPADFVILDIKDEVKVPLILGRPFLNTASAVIHVVEKELSLGIGKDRITFSIDGTLDCDESINNLDNVDDFTEPFEIKLNDHLFEPGESEESFSIEIGKDEAMGGEEEEFKEIKQEDKVRVKTSLEEPPNLELKDLPEHLEYQFLEGNNSLPLIISALLTANEKEKLIAVSPVQVVPKKGGLTVVTNDNNELVPTRTVTGWRVCIDYRKLNDATRKDHFPLPFIDQMLERLVGNEYYCFLDGFSGYFQIPIDLEDQEKTTFTCPFVTYAYRRMPFGLCNAPATFQRCMTAIFQDMIEDCMEVFMDDFSVFENYTTTKKELLAVVFAIEKFRSYLMLSKIIVYTDHSALKYLFAKPDAKPRLIRWILLLQEFDIEERDKKGAKNLSTDHLSRLENPDKDSGGIEVFRDKFPDEDLNMIKTLGEDTIPWYADFANYLAAGVLVKGMTHQQKGKFFSDLKHYFWFKPYLFRIGPDRMPCRCVSGLVACDILESCHKGPTGGHFGANLTARKVLESGFYWPTIYKDAYALIKSCDACQRAGNITKKDEMPQQSISVSEEFDVWGIDFMGPLPNSRGNKYILVAVDYVSKWAEAKASPTNDAKIVVDFVKSLVCRYGCPKAIISDRGTHFANYLLEKTLKRYGVHHRFSTAYHPQANGQAENTNRDLKRILEKTVDNNPKIWSQKFKDALWAYRTAYKTPIRSTPYRMLYGKACHLPFEFEYKALWAVKKVHLDDIASGKERLINLHELEELRSLAYENSKIYKEQRKKWHDAHLKEVKVFKEGDKVLMYQTRFKFSPVLVKGNTQPDQSLENAFRSLFANAKYNFRGAKLRSKFFSPSLWFFFAILFSPYDFMASKRTSSSSRNTREHPCLSFDSDSIPQSEKMSLMIELGRLKIQIRWCVCEIPHTWGMVYFVTLPRFGVLLGLFTATQSRSDYFCHYFLNGACEPSAEFSGAEFWSTIGLGSYQQSNTKESSIILPEHRLLHRMLVHSLAYRKAIKEKVPEGDLWLLSRLVDRDAITNLAYVMAKMFLNTTEVHDKARTGLCGGHFITVIAEKLGALRPKVCATLTKLSPLGILDKVLFRSMKLLAPGTQKGTFVWIGDTASHEGPIGMATSPPQPTFPGQSSHPPPSSQQSQQSGSSEPPGSGSIREAIQELSEQLGNEHHDIIERLDRLSYDMYGVCRELSWVTASMNEYFESVGHVPSAPLVPHPLWRDGDDAPAGYSSYDEWAFENRN
ncbi:hypothetical protein OSB04_024052 [Centaurea solstitialis]|uniref:Integrase catalytic domain-containing protein n=1 Tax=Centaurea solstitialis TaxID=347529 RepID=A0AA38SXR1_9ASTR|nr:hypothetical protein OSB04_024052 [Centaurea solstitialis]